MVDRMLLGAAKRIEEIAENPELGNDVRIKAHLLFGEFHSISHPGRGRRITTNAKKDLLTRMNDLINGAEGVTEPEPTVPNTLHS